MLSTPQVHSPHSTTLESSNINLSETLEMAKLYCDRGDYELALPKLNLCSRVAIERKDFSIYLKSVQYVLRIHAEREEYEQLSALKERLHDMVIREGFELNSRVYYVFGIAAFYKQQVETALEYFKIALEHGLKSNVKEDICYAILGITYCYRSQGKYEEALKEIYNLNIFLEYIDNSDLKSSVLSANALILMSSGKYEQALDILWQAYEQIKFSKQLSVANGILANIGVCLFEIGQRDAARVYFDIVHRSIDPQNGKKLYAVFSKYLTALTVTNKQDFDLSFDFENHAVV